MSSFKEAPLYLAIDAGGTKTDYLLADEEQQIARVRGGCVKRMRVDAATANHNLDAALHELAEIAGCSLTDITHTCVGTAGETVPLVVDWFRAELPRRIPGNLVLVGDVEIALDAAFQGGAGVLVLAGTGSNVAGRHQDGRLFGAGGWGPLMADQGSANRIGLSGLRAGFLAKDEGRQTALLTEALQFWQLETENDLVAFANSVPAPDFSKFSLPVHRLAAAGDPIGVEVLAREGRELGYLARLVLRRIAAGSSAGEGEVVGQPLRIAFAGSIMEHVPAVRRALLQEVHEEFPHVQEHPGVIDPIQGALWRARLR